MTIKATFSGGQQPQTTRTQATAYTDQLAQRFQTQQAANVPRSQGAWGAEQQRLGSWNSGVGALRPSGMGTPFSNGVGRPEFMYDPEEEERKQR